MPFLPAQGIVLDGLLPLPQHLRRSEDRERLPVVEKVAPVRLVIRRIAQRHRDDPPPRSPVALLAKPRGHEQASYLVDQEDRCLTQDPLLLLDPLGLLSLSRCPRGFRPHCLRQLVHHGRTSLGTAPGYPHGSVPRPGAVLR